MTVLAVGTNGQQYSTIASAVAASDDGDTIDVAASCGFPRNVAIRVRRGKQSEPGNCITRDNRRYQR